MRESSRSYRFPALLPGDVSWDSTDQSCVWIHRNNSPVFFWDPASYVAALQHHVSAIVTSLLYQISNRYTLLCWPHNLIAFFFLNASPLICTYFNFVLWNGDAVNTWEKANPWKALSESHQPVTTGRLQVYGRNILGVFLFLPSLNKQTNKTPKFDSTLARRQKQTKRYSNRLISAGGAELWLWSPATGVW